MIVPAGRSRIVLILVTILAAASTAAAGTAAAFAEARPVAPHDTMVDVRGAALHVRIYPGDARTILLVSGFALDASTWNNVAPVIAARTGATVISSDRAGTGRSAAAPGPYTIDDEVMRLHAALVSLGRNRWVVLLGHSYGGYVIQRYANLFPDDVRGLVYVDPNTVIGIDGIGGVLSVADSIIKQYDIPDQTAAQRSNLKLARALEATQDTMRRTPVVCGVPVDVIMAGKPWSDAWLRGQRDLVARSGGSILVAKDAGHMIQADDPEIVIAAAADVLRRAPARGARPGRSDTPCAR